jgi:adenylate kinase family enzyme
VSQQPPVPTSRANRIVIQGASGSGKTTLATELAARRKVPHLELDGLFHQANWTELNLEEFRSSVATFVARPQWVIDGNYSHVRDIVWLHADVIVFIDLPKSQVMRQVATRTLRRLLFREEMWNGNRESFRNVISLDPMKNIVVWSWTTHAKYHELVPEEARAHADHAKVVTLSSKREVQAFLESANDT